MFVLCTSFGNVALYCLIAFGLGVASGFARQIYLFFKR